MRRGGGLAEDVVAEGPVPARLALEGLGDQRGHALFEAFGDETAGDADGELAAGGEEADGVFEPGIEVVAGHLKLQDAEDRGPCLFGRRSGRGQKEDS